MNAILKNYARFSKKEGIAAIALAVVIIPLALLPFFNKNNGGDAKAGDNVWASTSTITGNNNVTENEPVSKTYYGRRSYYNNSSSENKTAKLFNFDPNTATSNELQMLGLRDKTVQILCNYRNKGGKFRNADDLKKIYGLRPEEFERLKPFITIQAENNSQKSFSENTHQYPIQTKQEWKRKVVAIDINNADTTAFQSLYGIGSKLAARIVNFRNKLGGFYTVEQVGETFGVPDSTFQKIRPYLKLSDNGIQKMNINTASYDELNAHPYISSKLAYLIMKQRKDAGSFSSLDALKELVGQTNDSFEKVVNYLSI